MSSHHYSHPKLLSAIYIFCSKAGKQFSGIVILRCIFFGSWHCDFQSINRKSELRCRCILTMTESSGSELQSGSNETAEVKEGVEETVLAGRWLRV